MKPIHVNKGKSILKTVKERTDYANNPDKTIDTQVGYVSNPSKTHGGDLVRSFECDPHTVDIQFLMAKQKYDKLTGRNQGKRDVLAYHVRQSFKPGEITPQEALEVGYELMSRFTKNKHAFIVAVHTDKAHIHCHAVFNSTSLDCERKFKNFWGSSFAIRRLSDIICLEHGLSVIENPQPSKGQNYGEWLRDKKLSFNEIIKAKVDEVLPSCMTFDEFIAALRAAGFIVDDKRTNISVRAPDQKRPTRLNSIGGDYTEAAIRARLGKERIISSGSNSGVHTRVNLLVDIQAKIAGGKGPGYEQWAKIFNLKQAAKTLIFLQENGIDSYEDLKKKSSSASGAFAKLTADIKATETRMKEVAELQKYIGQYGKTRDVYAKYKASGWSRDFYDEHAADIILHRAAKKYFDGLGMTKLPSINQLKQEYATLSAEKKILYANYHQLKQTSRDLSIAKGNADRILGITHEAQTHAASHKKSNRNTHEI